MAQISEKNIFYKLYLYYNLYIRHKAFKSRITYSQNQEDLFINNYFKNKKNGFYLDVGCYHPIKFSNTALLHNRGWQGINIDMSQTSIDFFNILRKKDTNICAAISNESKKVTQYMDRSFSPINTLVKEFSDTASKTISSNKYEEKITHTYNFSQIVDSNNIQVNQVDFLNIDAEAHDLEVLEGINLKTYKITLICIEMLDSQLNVNEDKFKNYLSQYNYDLIKVIGSNGFFELKS